MEKTSGNVTVDGLPLLMSLEQVCTELGGISRVTLWRLIRDGDIKSVRVGRRSVRIPKEELAAFVERAKAKAAERLGAHSSHGQK